MFHGRNSFPPRSLFPDRRWINCPSSAAWRPRTFSVSWRTSVSSTEWVHGGVGAFSVSFWGTQPGKTIGKPWENGGFMGFDGDIPNLVMTNSLRTGNSHRNSGFSHETLWFSICQSLPGWVPQIRPKSYPNPRNRRCWEDFLSFCFIRKSVVMPLYCTVGVGLEPLELGEIRLRFGMSSAITCMVNGFFNGWMMR